MKEGVCMVRSVCCPQLTTPSLHVVKEWVGSQGGLVVINHVSHLCDPGSTLTLGHMWAEFQLISM